MAVYINQINKRRAAEKAAMAEVNEKTGKRLGLLGKKHVVPQNDESALRQVLEALGITDYELEDDDLLTPEEQLTGILRPRGIMMRDIRLTGEWWRECVGPLLGYAKDGRLLALTPTKTGLGYKYRQQDGSIREVGRREMADELKPQAITFTKALPLKPLRLKDLIRFTWSVVSGPNALLLVVCALVVVLLGMFTPMANKLIFDTVIPTGDATDLLPIKKYGDTDLISRLTATGIPSHSRHMCSSAVMEWDMHLTQTGLTMTISIPDSHIKSQALNVSAWSRVLIFRL